VTSPWIFEVAASVLGLLLGSFLNVCISRVPKGESVVKPRSRCPNCSAPIRWYDNIPVLSWLLLKGRCRDCREPIRLRYPLVEIAVALWFMAVTFYCWPVSNSVQIATEAYASLILTGISLAILGFLLLGLMVMDWQTMLLPDAFTFTGIAIAFVLTCIRALFLQGTEDQIVLDTTRQLRLTGPGSSDSPGNVFLTGPENILGSWFVAILAAAAILLLVRWLYKAVRHREGMGLGDVKLIALIAAFLGFWPAILSLFLGVLMASVYAIVQLVRGRASGTTRLAFGSFLSAGGLIAALFGNRLIEIYASLLH
jgi:leader peptidase (prepilin peptidase)/N-methyltransferase